MKASLCNRRMRNSSGLRRCLVSLFSATEIYSSSISGARGSWRETHGFGSAVLCARGAGLEK